MKIDAMLRCIERLIERRSISIAMAPHCLSAFQIFYFVRFLSLRPVDIFYQLPMNPIHSPQKFPAPLQVNPFVIVVLAKKCDLESFPLFTL